MKRFIYCLTVLAAVCVATTGCKIYNDEVWGAIGDLEERVSAVEEAVRNVNSDLGALRSLVGALEGSLTIDSVTESGSGCTIKLSDGRTIVISNGGSTAVPSISIAQDADGLWYWTLDGEFITVDGRKVCASGSEGAAGVTPQIRVGDESGEWEYSLDEGATWTSTGVKAQGEKGEKGDSLFAGVTETDDEVVFTLADGVTEFVLPKTSALSFVVVRGSEGDEVFSYGESRTFGLELKGVEDYVVFSVPAGWKVSAAATSVTVKAPASGTADAEFAGDVVFLAASAKGATRIVRLPVAACELRVLTFEDADYKGPGGAGYWTSLVDSPEYGGELLYGDDPSDWMAEVEYEWTDSRNTMLTSGTLTDYGFSYSFGGCAVSNYVLADITGATFFNQLSVLPQSNGRGGHGGSENFCVCYDGSAMMGVGPVLGFADGEERIIDHMWVTTTAYTANSLLNVPGEKAGAGDWFSVTATGYDSDDDETGEVTIYLFREGGIVDDWTRWDLSPLGAVSYVEFKCSGTVTNAWGLATPTYFAFDDVAVRF